MIRLGRAGREAAIVYAIMALQSRGRFKMFTKGEICRKMGIKSSSHIRDILNAMVEDGRLVGASTALDGYAHEVAIYGLPIYEQMPLPDVREIIINGQKTKFDDRMWEI